MSCTKLTEEEKMIKERINNYIINSQELITLQERYEKYKDMNSNSISQYGSERAGGNMPSSKIENMVIQKSIIEEQIKNIEKDIEEISYALEQLKGIEKKIVQELIAMQKTSIIMKKVHITSRKKMDLLKKRIFHKMYDIICEHNNTK